VQFSITGKEKSATSASGARRDKAALSGGQTLQPEAAGAAMEVTR
jgi:hypothetical protein